LVVVVVAQAVTVEVVVQVVYFKEEYLFPLNHTTLLLAPAEQEHCQTHNLSAQKEKIHQHLV
jgi:hypothetical protein